MTLENKHVWPESLGLLVCKWRHGSHVGGQKQKSFFPLGNELYFDANFAKQFLLYWPLTWPPCHVVANEEYTSDSSPVFSFVSCTLNWEVIYQKRVRGLHWGIQTPRNKWKHEAEAECFYCFEVSGYPDEARSTSFWYSFLNKWPTIIIYYCCFVSLIKQ